jgi:hypothetical protein
MLLKKILEFDLVLRYTTQREEYLKWSCKSLIIESNDDRDDKQLLTYLDEMKKCSKSYRLDKQYLCALESLLPSGPFRRASDTWRSKPKWYLHLYLVDDCDAMVAAPVANVDAVRDANLRLEGSVGWVTVR